ncbi:hypothetical protein HYU06_00080 [Candidatus Woesearchaeota archaeon]|nr:hypothetical protein [Candidatus Woesearchaeota archaeon]
MEKTLFTLRPPTYYMALMSFIPLTVFLAAIVAFNNRNTIPNGSIIALIAFLIEIFFAFAIVKSVKKIILTSNKLIVSGFLYPSTQEFILKEIRNALYCERFILFNLLFSIR